MNFRHRCCNLSIMHMCRAFKHRKIAIPYIIDLDYHIRKQRKITRKEYENEKMQKYLNCLRKTKGQQGHQYVTLHVVSTGCHGMGRSVLLQTYDGDYLFNCGEGSKKGIIDIVGCEANIHNVLITHNSWKNVGGLLGWLLTDSTRLLTGNKKKIHGPYDLTCNLSKASLFCVSHRQLEDYIQWFGAELKTYEDSQLVIDYVELKSDKSHDTKHFNSDYSNNTVKKQDKPSTSLNENPVLSYIIKIKRQQLNNKRRTKKDRENYHKKASLKDDHKIKSGGFLNQENAFRPIIILDCPTYNYMDSLLTSENFIDFDKKYGCHPKMIVHMAPLEIIKDGRYEEFMSRFGDNTIHLMLNENCYGPVVHGAQEMSLVCRELLPDIFPQLPGLEDLSRSHDRQTGNIIQGVYSLQYIFNAGTKSGFQWDKLPHIDKESALEKAKLKAERDAWRVVEYMEEHPDYEKWAYFDKSMVDDEIALLKSVVANEDIEEDLREEYPEITFLGTGSFSPSCVRNTSCVLIQMKKDNYIMLDCGEGTLIQMYQMYGKDKTEQILLNLKAVFVSHHHSDNHGGLFGISDARDKLMEKVGAVDPLILVVPNSIKHWYDLCFNHLLGHEAAIRVFLSRHLNNSVRFPHGHYPDLDEVKKALNLDEFICVPVYHNVPSYGIVIKHEDGWKLTYSGACEPTPELIRHGHNCDVLIHEATLDDSMINIAIKSKHSTTSQAINVAEEMRAKFTILTHFSQRSTIPYFTDKFTNSIGFAFDFMQVRPSQFKLIPLLKPVLETLFTAGTIYALKKFQYIEQIYKNKYTDVVQENAVNALLSQKENRKQVQNINRKLSSEKSQLRKNRMVNEQLENRTHLKSSEDVCVNIEDIYDNNNTNHNVENETADIKITYSKNKVLIGDSLLKTLTKSESDDDGNNK